MSLPMDLTEKMLSREEKYTGAFLSVHVDQVSLPNGHTSFREVVEHVDGVSGTAAGRAQQRHHCVPVSICIRQNASGDPRGQAGPGEEPAVGALRELREETGAVPDILMPLGVILPSPGCYGEHLHLFLARELKMGQQQPDEDEFLRLERIPFQEMVHRIMNGEIEDAKTVAAVLKAKVLLDL